MQNIIIHCQDSMLETIKQLKLNWCYSSNPKLNEIDVIIPYTDSVESINNQYEDDELFVNHFGLDYEQVNCIQLI